MRIILAIDIIEGKCVRLTKGDYGTKKIYSEDPLEIALEAEGNGIKFLHLVDLDGAKQRKPENITVLEKIAEGTNLQIDFGGGIRTDEDINMAFNSGASQVTAGSVAVSDPDLFLKWLSDFGRDKLILGADFKNRKIATSGWLENSENDIITFLTEYVRKGVRYSICTDIERDGMLMGPATEIYNEILGSMDISLIASGGIASVSDIEKVKEAGCEGVIIGKAFYEGKISLKELGRLC